MRGWDQQCILIRGYQVQTFLFLSDTFKTTRKDIQKCILIQEPSRRKERKKMRSAKNMEATFTTVYPSIPLSLLMVQKKMEEQAPRKMLLFWGVHKSTVISMNCDFSPQINKINSLPWLSGTWCRSMTEQAGTSLYISFHAYQLMALKLSSQILSGSAVFNGIKQRWKIMPKEPCGLWKRPIP